MFSSWKSAEAPREVSCMHSGFGRDGPDLPSIDWRLEVLSWGSFFCIPYRLKEFPCSGVKANKSKGGVILPLRLVPDLCKMAWWHHVELSYLSLYLYLPCTLIGILLWAVSLRCFGRYNQVLLNTFKFFNTFITCVWSDNPWAGPEMTAGDRFWCWVRIYPTENSDPFVGVAAVVFIYFYD